jgi:hypothetical protein
MSGRLRAPVITPANELIDLATKISIRAASDQVDIFYTVPMLPRPWFLLFKKTKEIKMKVLTTSSRSTGRCRTRSK